MPVARNWTRIIAVERFIAEKLERSWKRDFSFFDPGFRKGSCARIIIVLVQFKEHGIVYIPKKNQGPTSFQSSEIRWKRRNREIISANEENEVRPPFFSVDSSKPPLHEDPFKWVLAVTEAKIWPEKADPLFWVATPLTVSWNLRSSLW